MFLHAFYLLVYEDWLTPPVPESCRIPFLPAPQIRYLPGPIIDELAKEYEGKVIMGKCDVDENSDLPAEFGIRNIPTVLFFKNGELVDKQVGAVGKPAFVEKVEKLL